MRTLLGFLISLRRSFMPRQSAARAQEELSRAIFDSAPIGVSIRDLHGRYVRANPAFQSMTGYTESELRGETDQSLTHPEELPQNLVQVEELLAGRRESFTLVKRYRTKREAVIWVRNTVSLLKDGGDTARYVIALTEDLTEERLAQEQRRESDELSRLLVASVAAYAIFSLDPQGRIASWNAGAERIEGYRAEEIIGRHFSVFYRREDVAQGKPARELEVAAAQGRFEEEGWRLRRDGSAFWANVVIAPIRDATGVLLGYAKVTHDLSERRRLEDRLRHSEASLKTFFNHSPALAFMKDLAGRYTMANQQFERRFGLSQQEILGSTDHQLFAPDQAAAFGANDREVLARGAPLEFEETAQYVDGPRISIVCKFPLYDATGTVAGIGGLVTDVTERKRAEDALRESQERLRLVLATLPIGVLVTDRDGDVILSNAAAKQVWGGNELIVSGRERWTQSKGHWRDSGKAIAPAEWPSARALSMGKTSLNELIDIETFDGRQKTIENFSAPIRNAEEQIVGAVIVNEDVTARVRTEEALRESRNRLQLLSHRLLEAQEEERRHLARELHDEFGQLLATVTVQLHAAKATAGEAAQSNLDECVALLQRAGAQVRSLALALRPTMLDTAGLDATLRWFAGQHQQRTGIVTEVVDHLGEVPDELAIACFRVVQEALTNALRHASAQHVRIELSRGEAGLELVIRDDGVGFDVKTTMEQAVDRGGLGLAGMKERMQILDGRLEVDSGPGRGTRISASLPLFAPVSAPA